MVSRTRISRRNSSATHPRSEVVELAQLKPAARKLRLHSRAKLDTLMRSLAEYGQVEPIVINGRNVIIHGQARFEAARRLEWKEVSVVRIEHLSDEELRTYALSANKFTLEAQWDLGEVRIELEELGQIPEIDLSLTSFSTPEIDTLRGAYEANALNDLEDDVPDLAEGGTAVSRRGDFWHLGRHHLKCGDATSADDLAALLGGYHADLLFTDPPYNVPINGHVSGLGKARHREFAMGCGEMGRAEFVSFPDQLAQDFCDAPCRWRAGVCVHGSRTHRRTDRSRRIRLQRGFSLLAHMADQYFSLSLCGVSIRHGDVAGGFAYAGCGRLARIEVIGDCNAR